MLDYEGQEIQVVTLEYYKVITDSSQISIEDIGIDQEDQLDIFKNNIIRECEEYKEKEQIQEIEEDDAFIEIISVDPNYLFCIIGKSTEITDGVLRRIRNKSGDSISQTDLNVEHYKYFLLDLNRMICVSMINRNFTAFKAPMTKFLERFNGTYKNAVRIERIIDTKIEEKLNRMTTLVEAEMEFAKDSKYTKSILNLKDAFGYSNDELSKVKIKFKTKNSPINEKFKEVLSRKNTIDRNFNSLKLNLEDENGEKEVIDLIERFLTKKIKVYLPEDYLIASVEEHITEIKKALMESLN